MVFPPVSLQWAARLHPEETNLITILIVLDTEKAAYQKHALMHTSCFCRESLPYTCVKEIYQSISRSRCSNNHMQSHAMCLYYYWPTWSCQRGITYARVPVPVLTSWHLRRGQLLLATAFLPLSHIHIHILSNWSSNIKEKRLPI